MAIILEEEKKSFNWTKLAIVLAVVLALAAAIYFVFFAPTPVFEIIVPPPLESAQKISSFQIDPANVLNSQVFRSLRSYAPLPTVGSLGRPNPFLPF